MEGGVYGFRLQELNLPFEPDDYARVAKAFLPKIPSGQYPHLRGLSQQVIDGIHDGRNDFRFGLEPILDGLEKVLRRR
jgi:hypothetical protein